jgi:hypothetical protein
VRVVVRIKGLPGFPGSRVEVPDPPGDTTVGIIIIK